MSDRNGVAMNQPDAALAAALRALSQSAPQPDLWPELARALDRKRRPRAWRYLLPAALAAGVALALLMPRSPTHDSETPRVASVAATTSTPDTGNVTAPAPGDEIEQLHERSQALERWIAAIAARAPQDSRDLMAAVEVEDLIGLVDVQLGGVRGDADALPLWRRRVALLQDLASIRGSAFAVAESVPGLGRDVPASL
jgi:hypothetical protein